LSECRTLVAAHLDQMGERLLERRGRRVFCRLLFRFVALGLDNLDDTLEAEESVNARRHRVDLAAEHTGHLDDRSQHVFIDAHRRDRVGALDVEVGIYRSARENLAGTLLGQGLEFIPSRRQPQPQVKALGVDRFQFPLERVGTADAVAPGKTGHAR